jgi:hypothetical protein
VETSKLPPLKTKSFPTSDLPNCEGSVSGAECWEEGLVELNVGRRARLVEMNVGRRD